MRWGKTMAWNVRMNMVKRLLKGELEGAAFESIIGEKLGGKNSEIARISLRR